MELNNVFPDEEERRRLIDSIPKVADADACKENIQPRRKGRSVASLVNLFDTTSSERESTLQAGHLKFQEQIDNADELDDPLQPYIDYIDWTIQMYPQGQSVESNLIGLLKSATDQFKNDRRYKYDPRYLKIWIEYSNWVNDPKEIFLYLMKQGIGQTLSLFYEEYADYYEKQNKFDEATQVYELGLKENADPIKRLQRSFDSFKARAEEKKRRGLVKKKYKEATIQMENLRSTGQRTMLGQKFDSQSRSSFAQNVYAGIESRHGESSNSSSQPQRNRIFGNDRPSSPTTPSFSVFVEPSTTRSTNISPSPSSSTSSSIPSSLRSNSLHITPTSSSRRENQKPVEKFAGSTLPQKMTLIQQQPPVERFEVYQDPEETQEPRQSTLDRSSSMLSVLSTDSESALSKLRRNPLSDEQIQRKRLKLSESFKVLENRFKANQHRYLTTALPNDRKEFVAILKDFDPDASFEEARFNAIKRKNKAKEKAIGQEEDGFSSYFEQLNETKAAPDYTTETLAAMQSIGGLFQANTNYTKEDDEDLTWNNTFQSFKSVQRPHTNEN